LCSFFQGLVFGGPYPGFSAPVGPGETDKAKIVAQHIKVLRMSNLEFIKPSESSFRALNLWII